MPAIPRPAQARINSWRAAAAELDAQAARIGATIARADTVAKNPRVQLVINASGAITEIGFTDDAISSSSATLGQDVTTVHALARDYLWQAERGADRSAEVDLVSEADPKTFDIATHPIPPVGLRPAPVAADPVTRHRYDPATDGDYNVWMRHRLERVLAAASASRAQLETLRGQGGGEVVRVEVDHLGHPVSVRFRSGIARLTPQLLAEEFAAAYNAARDDFRAQSDALYVELERDGDLHG